MTRVEIDDLLIRDNYFITSSDCKITVGATRTLITDFQRGRLFAISNAYGKLLKQLDRQLISELFTVIEEDSQHNFYEFLDFLVSEEIGFITANISLFPVKSSEWSSTSKITNAILDFNDNIYDYAKAIRELEILNCKNIQLRFYNEISNEIIDDILIRINECNMTFVDMYYPFSEKHSLEYLHSLVYRFSFLSNIYLYNSPDDDEFELIIETGDHQPLNLGSVYYLKQNIQSEKGCGIISLENMNFESLDLFNETQHHNGCLNRKVSVSKEGEIKNCPSFQTSYGHINNSSLLNVFNEPEFLKYFNITKDQIDICKDCEYRDNCTDCRAYLNDPINIFSKPLKCGYDPYTSAWEEWSLNPLKNQALNFYGIEHTISDFIL